VRSLVTTWPTGCIAALQVLVDELVTNAVLHARTDAELVATVDGHVARVQVRDASTHLPAPRFYATNSATGRGLHLIEALARRWGVDEVPGGKIVWFELACNGDGHSGDRI
jgi:anti-sigma regulatory factor (Ser/Thr protein kinase)